MTNLAYAGFAATVVVMLALGYVPPAYPDSYAPPSFTRSSLASLGGNCGSTSFVAQSGATTQCNLPGTGVFTALGVAVNASGGMTLLNGSITTGHCIEWSASGLQDAGAACSSFTPAGSSGAIQTNNGSGGLGSITPGAGVSTMLGAGVNTAGGVATLFFNKAGGISQSYPFWSNVPGYTASVAYVAGTNYCAPFEQAQSVHIDKIFVEVKTLGTGLINVSIDSDAIDSHGRHYPAASYLATTTPQVDTATGLVTFPMPTTTPIAAGENWLCFQASDTTVLMMGLPSYWSGLLSMTGFGSSGLTANGYSGGPQTFAGTYPNWTTNTGIGATGSGAAQMPEASYEVYSNP